jgi:hypothetical protein
MYQCTLLTTAAGCFCIYAGRLSEVILNRLLASGLLLEDGWLQYNKVVYSG